ncbi:hypothetical protein F5Y19DRAFT_490353 [Xylariaceae sp. FL1651]|nr:hypothetical protein F5Y19DRAFT_490353 [Xylariaceae sp. FL1651]
MSMKMSRLIVGCSSRLSSMQTPKIRVPPHLTTRLAHTSAVTREWLVIAPDEPGAIDRRLKARPKHLEDIKPDVDSGFLVFGGPYSSSMSDEGAPPSMAGSVIVMVAKSKEEVVDRLKKDLYTTERVWNWEKLQIYPFKSTIRKAME